MSRYRKIDTRIWNDENVMEMAPLEKLLWVHLLSHPQITPLGAGVLSMSALDEFIGYSDGYCWRHNDLCRDKACRAETILETFQERSLILCRDVRKNHIDEKVIPSRYFHTNGLIIIKNFLLYNVPENPNVLAGWIESVEELPRSSLWEVLRDHLVTAQPALPEWLFAGLLNPLANNQLHGLRDQYWQRLEGIQPKPKGRLKKTTKERYKEGIKEHIKKGNKDGMKNVRTNQEQEQEQEQYIEERPSETHIQHARVETPEVLRVPEVTHAPDEVIQNGAATSVPHRLRLHKHDKGRTDYSTGFLVWWGTYPDDRRISKPQCFALWHAHALEPRTPELVEKLERLKVTTWLTEERRYVKTSLPYLNEGRYEDDLIPLPRYPAQAQSGFNEREYRTIMAGQSLIEEIQRESRGQSPLLTGPGSDGLDVL